MSKFIAAASCTVSRFGRDRRGMETIQAVLLVALAAIMMMGVLKFFNGTVKENVTKTVTDVITSTSNYDAK